MRIAYFDCSNGISGDMIVASMINAGMPFYFLVQKLQELNMDEVDIKFEEIVSHGIKGIRFKVSEKEHKHHHRNLNDILELVNKTNWEEEIKKNIILFFNNIANAEAEVHGLSPDKVHFHEIGAWDSIIDICSIAIGMHYHKIKRVFASEVNLGSGEVSISHGKVPVPAPATALLLRNIPCYGSNIKKELTTPTGAAFLKTFAEDFREQPLFVIKDIGYGFGTYEIEEKANSLRLIIGEETEDQQFNIESAIMLETIIDDSSPEVFTHLGDEPIEAGAIDYYIQNIFMKKCRPGWSISVIVYEEKMLQVMEVLFNSTSTIGIRINKLDRAVLKRVMKEVDTECGKVNIKLAYWGDKLVNVKAEYDDLIRISREKNISFKMASVLINNEISKHYKNECKD